MNQHWAAQASYHPALVTDTWRKHIGWIFLIQSVVGYVMTVGGIYLLWMAITGQREQANCDCVGAGPQDGLSLGIIGIFSIAAGLLIAVQGVRSWQRLTMRRGFVTYRERFDGIELAFQRALRPDLRLAVPAGSTLTFGLDTLSVDYFSGARRVMVSFASGDDVLAFKAIGRNRWFSIMPLEEVLMRHGIELEISESATGVKTSASSVQPSSL